MKSVIKLKAEARDIRFDVKSILKAGNLAKGLYTNSGGLGLSETEATKRKILTYEEDHHLNRKFRGGEWSSEFSRLLSIYEEIMQLAIQSFRSLN